MQEVEKRNSDRLEEQVRRAGRQSQKLDWMIREIGELEREKRESRGEARNQMISEKILEAAELSDQLNGSLRELLGETGSGRQVYGRYVKDAPCLCQVWVRYRKNILEVCLPALLPHRKQPYAQFLQRPLSMALQEWCRKRREAGEELPRFKKAVLCFEHCYTTGYMRDHDNVEAKQVQDLLSLFFLEGDDGGHLDLYHTSRQDAENRTRIFLMEREHFPEWVMERLW